MTFVCDSKNAASSGYKLGLDTLILARVAGGPSASAADTAVDAQAQSLRHIGERGSLAAGELDALTKALAAPQSQTREAALWTLAQLRTAAAPAEAAIVATLGDTSPVVRGLAAVALRDLGPVSRSTLDALIARLTDADTGIRMMAADAITRQGLQARPAFDALLAAATVPDEHPHVQRSVANALGAIGPEANAALPALRALAKIPRVRWAADAAIKKIGG